MIVMDEATAALDTSSQDRLMRLVQERLPGATLVSVAHRVELEAFHSRKLVLAYCSEGARLVGDEALHPVAVIAGASRSRDHIRPVRQPRPARESVRADITPSRAHAVVEDFHSTAPAHIRPGVGLDRLENPCVPTSRHRERMQLWKASTARRRPSLRVHSGVCPAGLGTTRGEREQAGMCLKTARLTQTQWCRSRRSGGNPQRQCAGSTF